MPVLLRPWPDARASYSNERESQSLGKLRWWALPKADRRAVSTQCAGCGGAPPPDKPGNGDSSLHVDSKVARSIQTIQAFLRTYGRFGPESGVGPRLVMGGVRDASCERVLTLCGSLRRAAAQATQRV